MDHHHYYPHYDNQNQMIISNKNLYNSNTTTSSSTPRTTTTRTRSTIMLDQKKIAIRPQEHLNCPRCNSTNTKFCYYNNYSLTQPRYLCKACRRYWTEGGALRNVPVGGGSRKNKKLPLITSSSSSTEILPDLNPPFLYSSPQDLNLSFSVPMQESQAQGQFFNFTHHPKTNISPNNGISSGVHDLNLMTALESNTVYNNNNNNNNNNNALSALIRFHHREYNYNKTNLGFSLDGQEEISHDDDDVNGGGRILFPFGDIKQLIPATTGHNHQFQEHHHHHIHQEQHHVVNKREGHSSSSSNELWNGITIGGGPTW